MKTCPECKTAYKDDSLTRCPADGAELVAADSSAKTVKASDSPKSKGNLNLILIVGAVAVILGSLWWFTQRSNKGSAPVNSATNVAARANAPANPSAPDQKPPTMTDVPVGNAQTPTEAYRMLFAAVKSQDSSKIRSMLSSGSMGLAQMASAQQKKTIEEVIKNGFTETTFVDDYPQTRDERVKGNYGAVEVWNATRKQWDDIPFVYENGSWKAAFGDAFSGKFESPGKSQGTIEKENANANNPNAMIPVNPAGNSNSAKGNFRTGGRLPKPLNK